MAIRVTLDKVLQDRRMSLTELGERVGITLANLSILKTGKAKAIRFSTLEALCRELDCQPGDILVWDPGEASADDLEEEEDEPGRRRPSKPVAAE
jgi:putative transcriptional regulator